MKKIIILLSIFCVIAFSFMIITFVSAPSNVDFIPPNFDASAKTGIPEEPGNDWSLISQTNMSFSAHICGQFSVENKSANVYFTNDDTNVVWLKLRIFDERGNMLGETGLIKPNEYVEKIFFSTVPIKGQKIKMKIMSYEPNTYVSMGSVVLNTIVR